MTDAQGGAVAEAPPPPIRRPYDRRDAMVLVSAFVAAAIGAQVFFESRTGNSAVRAGLYGLLALVAGVAVATVKSLLAH